MTAIVGEMLIIGRMSLVMCIYMHLCLSLVLCAVSFCLADTGKPSVVGNGGNSFDSLSPEELLRKDRELAEMEKNVLAKLASAGKTAKRGGDVEMEIGTGKVDLEAKSAPGKREKYYSCPDLTDLNEAIKELSYSLSVAKEEMENLREEMAANIVEIRELRRRYRDFSGNSGEHVSAPADRRDSREYRARYGENVSGEDSGPVESNIAEVAAGKASVWTGPKVSDSFLFYLSRGDRVEVLEKYNLWARVRTPSGVEAWMRVDNLSLPRSFRIIP